MRTCRTISEVRAALEPCREGTIGLVPTMGALHAGHLSLLAASRAECDTVVMSLFVVTMAGFLPRHLMHVFGGE